jgi:RNA polymerase sigma-70 factor (ECF subfamily)
MAQHQDHTNPTEGALLSRLQTGDENAVQDIYLLYYNRLLQYGCSIENDRNLVHDTIQELFVWLLQNPGQAQKIQNLDTYLFKSIRRNVSASAGRERRSKLKAQAYQTEDGEVDTSTETKLIEEEEFLFKREWLKKQIGRLPQHQQEVIFLRFFENFDYDDIAEIYSVSNQVVRNTIFRAMKNLRKGARRFEGFWPAGLAYLMMQFFF